MATIFASKQTPIEAITELLEKMAPDRVHLAHKIIKKIAAGEAMILV